MASDLLSSVARSNPKMPTDLGTSESLELQILHGSDKYTVALATVGNDGPMTVKDLADKVEEISGVPIQSQRLINKGRSLSNLNASLQSYGITTGSKIMLLGNRPNSLYDSPEFQSICHVEKSVSTLENKLDEIGIQVVDLEKAYLQKDLACELLGKLNKQLKMVSEEFMKILEQLDGMTFSESQKEARLKRKSVVERIQKLLQRSDSITDSVERFCS